MTQRVQKTEAEWRQLLTPEQYEVIRNKGTERPFTGEYVNARPDGAYTCAACDATLFSASDQFNAHCGWPSFTAADEGSVELTTDRSHGMVRTEVTCAACGGHLGHLFEDGPQPTGMRYCINSVSIRHQDA